MSGAGCSQDSSFNANIHKLVLPAVPWYQERLLPDISLGSLVVVILIRTVKYNLSKLRDVYLHTNCLAALANMAPHVQNLNSYASQRLVSLFDMLARKCVASPFHPPPSLTTLRQLPGVRHHRPLTDSTATRLRQVAEALRRYAPNPIRAGTPSCRAELR
jgi:hypothetical protein